LEIDMAQHFYKVGDAVVVWNQTMSGREFCEGRARVAALCDRDHTYMVRFDGALQGDEGPYERRVMPDAADLPDDDPRVSPAPQPPVDFGSAFSRELPAA
jgi:hypothetical protein